jgi:hypothetical protein
MIISFYIGVSNYPQGTCIISNGVVVYKKEICSWENFMWKKLDMAVRGFIIGGAGIGIFAGAGLSGYFDPSHTQTVMITTIVLVGLICGALFAYNEK